MDQKPNRVTASRHFQAKWGVIAAVAGGLVGALAGAFANHVLSRGDFDAKLLEMRHQIVAEKERADRLERRVSELSLRAVQPQVESGSVRDLQAEAQSGSGATAGFGGLPSQRPVETPKAVPAPSSVVVQEPFRFHLKECLHSSHTQRVLCKLVVENLSGSEEPLLMNPVYPSWQRVSYLTTEDGTQYWVAERTSRVINRSSQEYVPGVPISVELVFPGVDLQLGQVALVVQADQGMFGRRLTVPFKQVTVREE